MCRVVCSVRRVSKKESTNNLGRSKTKACSTQVACPSDTRSALHGPDRIKDDPGQKRVHIVDSNNKSHCSLDTIGTARCSPRSRIEMIAKERATNGGAKINAGEQNWANATKQWNTRSDKANHIEQNMHFVCVTERRSEQIIHTARKVRWEKTKVGVRSAKVTTSLVVSVFFQHSNSSDHCSDAGGKDVILSGKYKKISHH